MILGSPRIAKLVAFGDEVDKDSEEIGEPNRPHENQTNDTIPARLYSLFQNFEKKLKQSAVHSLIFGAQFLAHQSFRCAPSLAIHFLPY